MEVSFRVPRYANSAAWGQPLYTSTRSGGTHASCVLGVIILLSTDLSQIVLHLQGGEGNT
jgi:hypothetical protein